MCYRSEILHNRHNKLALVPGRTRVTHFLVQLAALCRRDASLSHNGHNEIWGCRGGWLAGQGGTQFRKWAAESHQEKPIVTAVEGWLEGGCRLMDWSQSVREWCIVGLEGKPKINSWGMSWHWSHQSDSLGRHAVLRVSVCVCAHGGTLRQVSPYSSHPHQLLLTTDTNIIASTQLPKHMHWSSGGQLWHGVLSCKSMTDMVFSFTFMY